MNRRDAVSGLAEMAAAPRIALAQEYPAKPILMVMPLQAGGAIDITMRLAR